MAQEINITINDKPLPLATFSKGSRSIRHTFQSRADGSKYQGGIRATVANGLQATVKVNGQPLLMLAGLTNPTVNKRTNVVKAGHAKVTGETTVGKERVRVLISDLGDDRYFVDADVREPAANATRPTTAAF